MDSWNNRTAIAGRLTANGAGIFTDGAADVNQSGTFTTWMSYAANYTVSDTTSGRGIMILPPLVGGVPQSLNLVFYVVNAGKQFAMEVDPVTILTPLLNGVVLQQQSATGGFSNVSLNGGMVIYLTGRSASGGGGAPGSATGLFGTYSVASNGRAAIRIGVDYVAAYIVRVRLAPGSGVVNQ